jgi:hypothetical protein
MKKINLAVLLGLGMVVSACSTFEGPTRNAPMLAPQLATAAPEAEPRDYRLEAVRFAAPADLTVSEANSFYPVADIVWRGDPMGDRKMQISEIFQTAIRHGAEGLDGATPVIVDVTLARFHSLTERTRYSVGGVHSIKFDLTIRDAETGAVLEPTRRVNADLPGLGGQAAIMAEQRGETQKVRILAHLTALFRDNLTGLPGQGAAPDQPAS